MEASTARVESSPGASLRELARERPAEAGSAEAVDGDDAIEQTLKHKPDVVLMDVYMPRMDGISLVRHLRARGDHTPVIMISGQLDPRVVQLAYEAGVDHYLPKPLSATSLTTAIGQTFPGWAA